MAKQLVITAAIILSLATLAVGADATPPTPIAFPGLTVTPVDTAQVEKAIEDVKTADAQLLGIEVKVNADLDVIAGVLKRCGYTLPAVTSAAGTPTYANEIAARNTAVVNYCADPAAIGKVKTDLTKADRDALSNAKLDLLGLQAQLPTVLTAVTTALVTLQNAVLGLPALMSAAGSGGNAEQLSKLSADIAEILPKAFTLPTRVNAITDTVAKVIAFTSLVL